jgi:hypothetical protein
LAGRLSFVTENDSMNTTAPRRFASIEFGDSAEDVAAQARVEQVASELRQHLRKLGWESILAIECASRDCLAEVIGAIPPWEADPHRQLEPSGPADLGEIQAAMIAAE